MPQPAHNHNSQNSWRQRSATPRARQQAPPPNARWLTIRRRCLRYLFAPQQDLPLLIESPRRVHANAADIVWRAPAQPLPLERDDMLELLGNLLDNACKWARRSIELSKGVRVEGSALPLQIELQHDGPGIDEALRAQPLARGSRLDEQIKGHGSWRRQRYRRCLSRCNRAGADDTRRFQGQCTSASRSDCATSHASFLKNAAPSSDLVSKIRLGSSNQT